ncbi:GNAT family protein [Microbacterium pumilum]|uniref:GNAT family N-acetyltransferase n=1 Tax=Microbacterium pumilum TaxID=344165 RepID=A0ABN2SCR3_9MICO
MEPAELRTARAVLSAPNETDVDAIFEACQDPAIQRYVALPSPYERKHAEGFIPIVAQHWAKESEYTWAVRADDDLAGVIALLADGDGAAEIGYWMVPRARGRGLLTEAARAVIDWGFSPDGGKLERIEWRSVAGNIPSARTARALGFRYEGLLRRAQVGNRGREDGWIAGLLATDDRMPQVWPVLERST